MKRIYAFVLPAITVLLAACSGGNADVSPYGTYSDGMLSSITPKGWIGEFLERQRTGLSGHPEAMSYPYDTKLWNGDIKRVSDHGAGWWRYEQTAYYSDGLLRLGYALRDDEFIKKIEDGIRYTIAAARPDGRLGSDDILNVKERFMWPQAVYFRAMKAMYEATGDQSITSALEKYYLHYTPKEIGLSRNVVNIEGILWTYGKTGNADLLKLAEDTYATGNYELAPEFADKEGCQHIHGVTYCEELKLPELLYAYTGKQEYKRIADNLHAKLVDINMLPDGVPTSVEHLMGNSIDHGHETCVITDFTWTEGYFLMTTGDPVYADRIEKAVFNAAPGSITKDFKAMQYFSNINQFNSTSDSDPNRFMRGLARNAYRSSHDTECCIGNVHRIMPNYVSRMWMKDRKGNLVAALYGPSEIECDGMRVEEITDYPFDGRIKFVFHPEKAARRKFSFRIPSWCDNASATFNGKIIDIRKEEGKYSEITERFREGDELILDFEMKPHTSYVSGQGVAFERGPLLFAYHIPEKWTEDTAVHPEMRGKKSANPNFKCWDITAAAPFGYAIDKFSLELISNDVPENAYPFDNPPYSIRIPVREIDWPLDEGKYTSGLPSIKAKYLSDEEKYIDLVPYGCTQLRLTVFPIKPHRVLRNDELFDK